MDRQYFKDMKDLNKRIDQRIRKFPKKICRIGCSSCCKVNHVRIFEIERENICHWIEQKMPSDQIKAVRNNMNKWFDCYDECVEQIKIDNPLWLEKDLPCKLTEGTDLPQLNYIENQLIEKNIDCPYLDNDLCLIYSVRPLSCRIFFEKETVENCKARKNIPENIQKSNSTVLLDYIKIAKKNPQITQPFHWWFLTSATRSVFMQREIHHFGGDKLPGIENFKNLKSLSEL